MIQYFFPHQLVIFSTFLVYTHTCETFAQDSDIRFNTKKTVYMCCKPNGFTMYNVPNIQVGGVCIKVVPNHKYLGMQICCSKVDDVEMSQQLQNIYARGNTLICTFNDCFIPVKCPLFSTYCSSLWLSFME